MKINNFKELDGRGMKIAIVQSRFNEKITNGLKNGAISALLESGVKDNDISIYMAPGSFEIPLFCQNLAKVKKVDGIIALGAVIKGETAHFEYVSSGAINGIMSVMLDKNIPIALGILTAYNSKQAHVRSRENKNNKGREAAMALVEFIGSLRKIK